MSTHLTIAQVTDMHITPTDAPLDGIPVRQQFLEVLQILSQKPLDLLILSGDLAASSGEIESYLWLKQALSAFPCPYLVMAGNHDDAVTMATIFAVPDSYLVNGMLCFSHSIHGKRLLFLDSSSYSVPPQQLTWLQQQLTDEPTLLFIHHPPALCGCRFMDEGYPLQNINEVWSVLTRYHSIKHIFCGHYHTEKTVLKEGKAIYLTPSTAIQIDCTMPHFVIEHSKPGWRMIEWNDKEVHTYVEYTTLD